MELNKHQKLLYRKAIADPSSITPSERSQILDRLPLEEEDRLCRAKVGLSKQDLIAKTIASPNELSEDEVHIIRHGAASDRSDRVAYGLRLQKSIAFLNMPDTDRSLLRRAQQSIQSVSELQAQSLVEEPLEASIRKREQRHAIIQEAITSPCPRWLQELLDAKQPWWGFVCFCAVYTKTEVSLASFSPYPGY
ncbi:hypothetical protein BP6252_07298 [Coleophoma cylindrospora]|uniref:Uncharacterized protein n=1 Tax=Coleophoma cylindrospora TaxID=1849047 RepID=A0A3D8RHS1_9HELO|nr:hypothetical protein BP6252_07298 [Coleophoma cylindrospora]